MAALGCLPMGLAIYCWDHGLKRGDIQALGAFSYVEPFVGAILVALFTSSALDLSILWSGLLVVGGAVMASASLWRQKARAFPVSSSTQERSRGAILLDALAGVSTVDELACVSNSIVYRLMEIRQTRNPHLVQDTEKRLLSDALALSNQVWDELFADPSRHNARPEPGMRSVNSA